jgi:hypothetical protein
MSVPGQAIVPTCFGGDTCVSKIRTPPCFGFSYRWKRPFHWPA